MKTALFALTCLTLSSSAFAQGKVDYQPADTIKSVLDRQVGQKVELRFGSGDKIAGKVEKVGEKTVHLSAITGLEFFDAVVAIEEVAAVLVRTK